MLLFNHAFSEEGGKEKIFLFLSTITLISALRGWKLGSSLIPFRQRVYGSNSQRLLILKFSHFPLLFLMLLIVKFLLLVWSFLFQAPRLRARFRKSFPTPRQYKCCCTFSSSASIVSSILYLLETYFHGWCWFGYICFASGSSVVPIAFFAWYAFCKGSGFSLCSEEVNRAQ